MIIFVSVLDYVFSIKYLDRINLIRKN